MFSSEFVDRHVSQPNTPRGNRSPKQKPPVQHQQSSSSGWGWPRFVSVEVDVEEKRRQKKNEAVQVNATAELSRPEQGARNQSFQRAHEHMAHTQPQTSSTRRAEKSDESTATTAIAPQEHHGRETENVEDAPPATATERRSSRNVPGKDTVHEGEDRSEIRPRNLGSVGASKTESFPERKESITKGPQPQAEAESETIRDPMNTNQAQSKEDAKSFPKPTDSNSPVEQRQNASSITSPPQANDSTPGAFPKDDSESVYSQLSLSHEEAREPSDATREKGSPRKIEFTQEIASKKKDEVEGHSTPSRSAGGKAKPDFSIGPANSDSSGQPSGEETEILDGEDGHPHPSKGLVRDLSEYQSPESIEARPQAAEPSTEAGSASADIDIDQQSDSLQGRKTSNARHTEGTITEHNEERGTTPQTSGQRSAETVAEDSKTNHPFVSDPNPIPVAEEQEHYTKYPEPGSHGSTFTPVTEEKTGIRDHETSPESKPYMHPESETWESAEEAGSGDRGRVDEFRGSGPESDPVPLTKRVSTMPASSDSHRGSGSSKPEPLGVVKRMSTMPPSINDRRSSKSPKKVTLPPPKIFVQSPSEVTQDERADPNPTPAEQLHEDEYRTNSRNGSVVSVQRTVASAAERLSTAPMKKRKLYLRKARNLAARSIFLNATLGRKIGKQTKLKLRRLAKGEDLSSRPLSTQPRAADSPPLKKRQSFIRKARSMAMRQAFLNATLGRQVAGETRPVLRRMANGESIVVDDT